MGREIVGRISKIENWREIVEDLKAGPDFGIHGPRPGTLNKILKDGHRTIYAHYLGVGEKEKQLLDEEFYNRLWCSVDCASIFSYDMEFDETKMVIDENPSLLLGVQKGDDGLINTPSCHRANWYGDTFNVGEDFDKCVVRLSGLLIDKSELEKIDEDRFSQRPGLDNISRVLFVKDEVMRRFIPKVHEAVRGL